MPRPLQPATAPAWWPRLTWPFAALCGLLAGAFVLMQFQNRPGGSGFLIICIALPAVLVYWQQKRLAKRVLIREGVTCPCCLRLLADDEERCTHCGAGHDRSVYVDYWTLASTAPAQAEPWWRSMNEAQGRRGKATYCAVRKRWQLGLLAGCLLLVILGTVVLRPAALLSFGSMWVVPIYACMIAGGWVIRAYGTRRVGSSTHCARCDYQVDPTRLDMAVCSECGGSLTQPKQTVTGRRTGHRGYSLLGLGIIVMPTALMFTSLFGGFFDTLSPHNYLPVSIYVDDALGGDPDYKTWDVLESRYATPEDVKRLADAMVAQIRMDGEDADSLWRYGMGDALAFQLEGPHATDATKQEVALALIEADARSRVYQLDNWLERYLQTLGRGSNGYPALLAAAETAFASGTLDYDVVRWLEKERGERLSTYNEFGRFCRGLLRVEVVSAAESASLVIRTNPNSTLSPGLRPDEPVTLYLRLHKPGDPATQPLPSDLRYDPFEHLGRAHTLATIDLAGTGIDPADCRLHYVVYMGEHALPASIVEWFDGHPMFPMNFPFTGIYGPMELAPGQTLARDLRLRPSRGTTGTRARPPGP